MTSQHVTVFQHCLKILARQAGRPGPRLRILKFQYTIERLCMPQHLSKSPARRHEPPPGTPPAKDVSHLPDDFTVANQIPQGRVLPVPYLRPPKVARESVVVTARHHGLRIHIPLHLPWRPKGAILRSCQSSRKSRSIRPMSCCLSVWGEAMRWGGLVISFSIRGRL